MKIGILTFHYAHNCGASLQAFALKEYLKKSGHEVSIVNYNNKKIYDLYPQKLKVKFLLYDFKHPKEFGKKIKIKRDYRYGRKQWRDQYQKFESFIDTYLLDSNTSIVTKENISRLTYDVIIGGSDQIWNKVLTGGLDDIYLLNFHTDAHKVFYAASSGSDAMDENDLEAFKKVFVDENKYISVRESSLSSFLSNRFDRNVPSVVDPCFLLKPSDYIDFFSLNEQFVRQPKRKYLFAYFISEKNKAIREMVTMIANALSLEIIEFHYRKGRDLDKKYQISDMGPIEFLKYIYNADYVVTNSFHGTVFSIMFKKQFYSVYDEDARKTDLLNAMGLSKRHIRSFPDIDLNEKINYEKCNLDEYSASSRDFLNKMVKEYE